jgi:DUF2917 family protein
MEVRTLRLRPGQCLRFNAAAGHRIRCCAGRVWITHENDARDIFLDAGGDFTFRGDGVALVTAEEGMRGEWLEDTGIAVIAFSSFPDN